MKALENTIRNALLAADCDVADALRRVQETHSDGTDTIAMESASGRLAQAYQDQKDAKAALRAFLDGRVTVE